MLSDLRNQIQKGSFQVFLVQSFDSDHLSKVCLFSEYQDGCRVWVNVWCIIRQFSFIKALCYYIFSS